MKQNEYFTGQLKKLGPSKPWHWPTFRGVALVSIFGAIMVSVCCLFSCVPLETPRAGKPVVISPGQVFIYGRIRMFDATQVTVEYSPFWFDPFDQPLFSPGPRMTLEIRQLFPSGGMFTYKSYPNPPIEKNGSFFWILSAGDYALAGNPRLLGSKRFAQGETVSLTRFSAPETGGTIYVGTLIIDIEYTLQNMIRALHTGEAEYEIQSLRMVDDHEKAFSELRERFPVFPEPRVTEFMRVE